MWHSEIFLGEGSVLQKSTRLVGANMTIYNILAFWALACVVFCHARARSGRGYGINAASRTFAHDLVH